MSNKGNDNNVVELKKPKSKSPPIQPAEVPVSGEPEPPNKMNLDNSDLDVGYVVAAKKNGDFVFEILGESPTITSLIGIHEVAGSLVKTHADQRLMKGDALVHELAKLVMLLSQKVEALGPGLPRPSNKL